MCIHLLYMYILYVYNIYTHICICMCTYVRMYIYLDKCIKYTYNVMILLYMVLSCYRLITLIYT